MPCRILKDSICTSESIDGLSWFEECLFYRLIVNCDDYGLLDARPAILKARLFPLKDRLNAKDISAALVSLADMGLVRPYTVNGRPYLCLPSWEVHQNIRAKKAKYPKPEEGSFDLNAVDNRCMQMYADDIKCPRNPIQSNTNPNPNPNTNTNTNTNTNSAHVRSDTEQDFDKFWLAYPKKVGKEQARKAFRKVNAPLETLLAAIAAQSRSAQWSRDNGQFIPNPSTWLNQQRWNDELPTAAKPEIPKGASGDLGAAELEAIQRVLNCPDIPFAGDELDF